MLWVGLAEASESGWPHYCTERGQSIRLRVSHAGSRGYVFCPLCGGIVRPDSPLHRYDGRAWAEIPYDAPLCPHGHPDGRCLDFAAASAELGADYEYNIQEYGVARLSSEHGIGQALQDWARPCARCRNDFAERHYPTLIFELERLHEAISQESRHAQAAVREAARAEHLVNSLERWLQGIVYSLHQRPEQCHGFVYAVSNGEAIKIGWSARHPASTRGRVADLQIGSHTELKLVGAVEGTRSEEQDIHVRFARHRLRGEWFKAVPEILEHFGVPSEP